MKKVWANAVVEELVIEATAGGGKAPTTHDGEWAQREDGTWWEGTIPTSNQ